VLFEAVGLATYASGTETIWKSRRIELEEEERKMQVVDVQDYARQLFEAHGDKAVAEAAQKARALEEQGKNEEAKTWRLIEAAVKEMLGPHQS